MKKLAAIAAVLTLCATAVGVSAARADRNVTLQTKTTNYPFKELKHDLPAFQHNADLVRRWWGGPKLNITIGPKRPGEWHVTVVRNTNLFGPLGYHYINPNEEPYAMIFATGQGDSMTLSHELEEMQVDPMTTRTARGSRTWLVEVSDPVESDAFVWHGTVLSDFVGPNWYVKGATRHIDYLNRLGRSETLGPYGYATYWNGEDWVQIVNW